MADSSSLSERGYDSEEDNAGEIINGNAVNVIENPGTTSTSPLLFMAHMDTEPGRGRCLLLMEILLEVMVQRSRWR